VQYCGVVVLYRLDTPWVSCICMLIGKLDSPPVVWRLAFTLQHVLSKRCQLRRRSSRGSLPRRTLGNSLRTMTAPLPSLLNNCLESTYMNGACSDHEIVPSLSGRLPITRRKGYGPEILRVG